LTLIEREEISRGIVAGKSIPAIAAAIDRAPSTISREIRRNEDPQGYRASQADQAAGIGAVARRSVSWYRTERWPTSWRMSSASSGRLSKLPAG
jgi:IS30 family transposase